MIRNLQPLPLACQSLCPLITQYCVISSCQITQGKDMAGILSEHGLGVICSTHRIRFNYIELAAPVHHDNRQQLDS